MKVVVVTIIISIVIFALIFYSFAGKSGGDIAIMGMNIIAGVLQMFAVSMYMYFAKKGSSSGALLALLVMQVLEQVVLNQYGLDINHWIVSLKN